MKRKFNQIFIEIIDIEDKIIITESIGELPGDSKINYDDLFGDNAQP